ncbi:hypothetical protein KNV22_gp28 [Gordonia phage Love]|uniref:Uncharacterized protein n=1 Tax=Gordonia phage Love TaxID=2762401 RepID=A0A7G8LKH6_9CAUD|nr:hypothetical protein KNV22_gp28 [Gordonia phage Love]QNJ57748.1 hypothetical protein SEA_LOVE_28 [Gordonia phage Love]
MHGKTHILLSEHYTIKPSGTPGEFLWNGKPVDLVQPSNPVDFGSYADELTWILAVQGVTGSPTAWSLGAKFQYCQPNTSGYQYTNSRWFDLQAENVATNVVEGVGFYGGPNSAPVGGAFGVVAKFGDTVPVTVQRTIRNFGLRCRVALDLSISGGTDPGIKVSLTAMAKG